MPAMSAACAVRSSASLSKAWPSPLRRGFLSTASLARIMTGKGTVLLDEVADLPLSLQGRLLRVLETGVFRRLGGHEIVRTDLRVVSTMRRDLVDLVSKGLFREDLYIPASRRHRDDSAAAGKDGRPEGYQRHDASRDARGG